MKWKFRRLLREPLVHFLVLGALLFVLFHIVKGESTGGSGKIVVSSGTIRSLSANFQRTWQRPPTKQELDHLVQEYIKEEIYYREALAMGLDRNDTIIRRRLRQKLEFLTDGIVSAVEPTEEELQKYLKKHPEKFRVEPRYTFSQVYLNPERHEGTLKQEAEKLLTKLNQLGQLNDSSEFGDSFMMGYYFSQSSESNVSRTFGEQFTKELLNVETGKWVGPVESGYGIHLVFISDKTEPQLPALHEVREQVEREWAAETQKRSTEKYYQNLRERYTISIEEPVSARSNSAIAAEEKQ